MRGGINLAVGPVVGGLKGRGKMIGTIDGFAGGRGGARVGAFWEVVMFGGTCMGNCVLGALGVWNSTEG